jgi:hypothetical protein
LCQKGKTSSFGQPWQVVSIDVAINFFVIDVAQVRFFVIDVAQVRLWVWLPLETIQVWFGFFLGEQYWGDSGYSVAIPLIIPVVFPVAFLVVIPATIFLQSLWPSLI